MVNWIDSVNSWVANAVQRDTASEDKDKNDRNKKPSSEVGTRITDLGGRGSGSDGEVLINNKETEKKVVAHQQSDNQRTANADDLDKYNQKIGTAAPSQQNAISKDAIALASQMFNFAHMQALTFLDDPSASHGNLSPAAQGIVKANGIDPHDQGKGGGPMMG